MPKKLKNTAMTGAAAADSIGETGTIAPGSKLMPNMLWVSTSVAYLHPENSPPGPNWPVISMYERPRVSVRSSHSSDVTVSNVMSASPGVRRSRISKAAPAEVQVTRSRMMPESACFTIDPPLVVVVLSSLTTEGGNYPAPRRFGFLLTPVPMPGGAVRPCARLWWVSISRRGERQIQSKAPRRQKWRRHAAVPNRRGPYLPHLHLPRRRVSGLYSSRSRLQHAQHEARDHSPERGG